MLKNAADAAANLGKDIKVGNVFTADLFYTPLPQVFDLIEKHGILGVEMEAAGLYGVAAEYGKKALAILTVSDHIRTGESLSSELRQTAFKDMMEIALESTLLQ